MGSVMKCGFTVRMPMPALFDQHVDAAEAG